MFFAKQHLVIFLASTIKFGRWTDEGRNKRAVYPLFV